MDYYNQILSEQLYPYSNLTLEERNFYLNLLLHTKEISDSQNNVSDNSKTNYDIEYLNLSCFLKNKNKENALIDFEGTITNRDENRIIRGTIFKHKHKYTVNTSFYRTSGYIDEDECDFKVIDEFDLTKGKVTRQAIYRDKVFEDIISLAPRSEVEEYIIKKVRKL